MYFLYTTLLCASLFSADLVLRDTRSQESEISLRCRSTYLASTESEETNLDTIGVDNEDDCSSDQRQGSSVRTAIQCPLQCKCTSTYVNCSGAGLWTIPPVKDFPPDTITMDFSGNKLTLFHSKDFIGLPNLRNLNLSRNQIWLIDELWNVSLPELQTLDLSDNRIPCGCPLHRLISNLAAAGVKLLISTETESCTRNTSLPLLSCADEYVSCLSSSPDSALHYSLVTPVSFSTEACFALCFRYDYSYYSRDDIQRCLCGSDILEVNGSCVGICSRNGDSNTCNKTIIQELHSIQMAISLSAFSHYSVFEPCGFHVKASAPVKKFVWEFEDGSKPVTTGGRVMNHKYSLPGQYLVKVKAEGKKPSAELLVTITVPVDMAELQCPVVAQTGQSLEVWMQVKQGTHLQAVYGIHQQDGQNLTDESSCPRGGRIFLGNLHCYWLSYVREPLISAQSRCSSVSGCGLAYITSLDQLSFIQESFSGHPPVWINMKQSLKTEDRISLANSDDQKIQDECIRLPLIPGKVYQRSSCMEKAPSLCQCRAGAQFPDAPVYLVGVPVFEEAATENTTLSPVHEDLESNVEVMLFPGLWFSHSGHLLSLEMGIQPLQHEYQARVQILRPFCSPEEHLLPPGCESQSPFATCHHHSLCNTTVACPIGKQWCSLTETCLSLGNPCSIYASESYMHPPRYVGIPPLYSPVADIPLHFSPSRKRQNIQVLLSYLSHTVHPDDIISIQHTGVNGSFLHCTSNSNSLWRQSYISMTHQGWLKESVLIHSVNWVDDVVCDLHVLYGSEAHSIVVSPLLWSFQEAGTYIISAILTNEVSSTTTTCEINILNPITDVQIIHPTFFNSSLHLLTQEANLVVISARSTSVVRVHWLTSLSTESIMQQECPSDISSSLPICTAHSGDVRFSWISLHFNNPQSTVLSIQLTNEVSVKSVTIQVQAYDVIKGLQIRTDGSNHIQLNQTQTFTAELSHGSSVTFTWTMDDNKEFSYKGACYTVTFRMPGVYNLMVVAENPVSSLEVTMMLHVDGVGAPLRAELFLFSSLLLVAKTYEVFLKIQMKKTLNVTIRWDFGDGSPLLYSGFSPPYDLDNFKESLATLNTTERHIYTQPENYQIKVTVYQGGSEITSTAQIQVVSPLTSLTLEVDHSSLRLHTAALFSALCLPSAFAVTFTWNFGDESGVVQSRDCQIQHVYKTVGSYQLTVTASNDVSHINKTLMVTIEQQINGLEVQSNSPTELGTEITVLCFVRQGTNIIWTFDMGDGTSYINQSEASVNHIYNQWGNFSVAVTARNALSSAHDSLTVHIYRIQVNNVLPEITTSLLSTQFTAYLTMPSKLQIFHWDFGDGSPSICIEGKADVWHTYHSAGNYTIKLIMTGDTDFYSQSITVEDKIVNITIISSHTAANVAQLVFFYALVKPLPDHWHSYQYQWDFGLGIESINTSSSEVTRSYMFEGHYKVTVTVWNQISQQQAWCFVTVQQPIISLTIEHNGGTIIPQGVEKLFTARVRPEVMAQFTWHFGDVSSAFFGQNVTHSFQQSGNLTVRVCAKNNVSYHEVTYSIYVQAPVKDLSLTPDVVLAKCKETVNFYATLSSGDDVQYLWSMCDSCPYLNGTSNISHTFFFPGIYMVSVRAKNTVSSALTFVTLNVQEQVQDVSIWQENAQVDGYAGIGESLTLTVHVRRGSNITFHWKVIPGPLESQNSSITFLPLELGNLFADVWVANALGRVYAHAQVQIIERIRGVAIQKSTDGLATGLPLNLTVHVQSGTEMHYTWDLGEGAYLHIGKNKSMTVSYLTSGWKVITVTVSNALSSTTKSTKLIVHDSVSNVSITINGIYNIAVVPTGKIVLFCGLVGSGTELRWEWRLSGLNEHFKFSTQNVSHTFKQAGEYELSHKVYNSVSNATVFQMLLVQEAITDFKINTLQNSVCTGQEVTFCPSIQHGTNVTFMLACPQLNFSQLLFKTCGQFSFPFPGIYVVLSSAYNKVSFANYTLHITVLENIKGLKVLGLPSVWPVKKTIDLLAEVEYGYALICQWVFQEEDGATLTQTRQRVKFTPLEPGTLHIVLNVSNSVCFSLKRSLVIVQVPVTSVLLEMNSEEVFLHQCVIFKACVSDGSDLHYQWTIEEIHIKDGMSSVKHCYNDTGEFVTNVTVFNLVSMVYAYKRVNVRLVDCKEPLAWLVESPEVIYRSDGGNFEASVNLRGCYKYKVRYRWQVYRKSDNQTITLPQTDMSNSLLIIPGHFLDIGMYCLHFTVTLQGTPLSNNITHLFQVTHSLLVALIHGGSKLIWPAETHLTLDGSKSYDPDQDDCEMKYEWSSEPVDMEDQSCFLKLLPNLPTFTITWSELCSNISYIFTLTVWKPGRIPGTTKQTVFIHSGPVFPVYIRCISCDLPFSNYISNRSPVILHGECGGCHNDTLFRWNAVDSHENPLVLDKHTTTTGSLQRELIIRKGALQDDKSYIFTLHIIQQIGPGWGTGSIMLTPNHPPTGGKCSLLSQTNILSQDTPLKYNCTGWKDPDMGIQLFYILSIDICSFTSCQKLYLYRGLKSSHSVWVPVAVEVGNIQIYIEVEDMQGAWTLALNRSLSIVVPFLSQGVSITQWLRNHSDVMLQRMQVVGDSALLLPLALKLILTIKLDNNLTEEEHKYHISIFNKVTDALSSCNVSSLWEVAAFSAALTQCLDPRPELETAVLLKVLNFTEKMINVLNAETNKGRRYENDIKKNILIILGCVIDASHSDALSIYAFNLTRYLTITLCKLHMAFEELLSMNVPGVKIQAIKVHPKNILCSSSPYLGQKAKLQSVPDNLLDHPELIQLFIELDNDHLSGGLFPNISITSQLVALEFISPKGDFVPVKDLPADATIQLRMPVKKEVILNPISVFLLPRGSANFTVTIEERTYRSAGVHLYIMVSIMNMLDLSQEVSPELLISYGPVYSSNEADTLKSHMFTLTLGQKLEQNLSLLLPNVWSWPTSMLEYQVDITSLLSISSVTVSVSLFSSLCQYFHMPSQTWRTEGVTPSNGSLPHEAVCQTNHLTLFGASMFVPPHQLILLHPVPRQWTLVLMCCLGILCLYLLLVLISHKLDHMDVSRVGTIPLCGPAGQYRYWVLVKTGWRRGAGTTAHVGICLYGVNKSGARHLQSRGGLNTGNMDMFQVETDGNLGEIWKIRVWHDNTGLDPSWFLQYVAVWDKQTDFLYFFVVNDWLSVDNERNGGRVEKEILATCPQELSSFSQVFPAQLALGLTDWHLWLSVWWRPAQSRFTRIQRVTCCALTFHLYMAACSLWYGATGVQGESLPLGFQSLVTWQSVCIGILTSVMALPVQLLFSFFFRETRSLVFVEDSVTSASATEEEIHMDSPSILSIPGRADFLTDSSSVSHRSVTSSKFTFDLGKDELWHLESSAPFWMSSCESLYDVRDDIPLKSGFSFTQSLFEEKKNYQSGKQSACSSGDDPLSLSEGSSCSHHFTFLEENLLQSTVGEPHECKTSESDSGRFSPRPNQRSPSTESGYSHMSENTLTHVTGCWSVNDQYVPMRGSFSSSSVSDGSNNDSELQDCWKISSASPSPFNTRIGIRWKPLGWLFPSGMLWVVYAVSFLIIVGCAVVTILYVSSLAEHGFLLWLISCACAVLTSAILLEPFRVLLLSFYYALHSPPVLSEGLGLVEEPLVKKVLDQFDKVRAPGGFSLLQAKEEARRMRALKTMIRSCTGYMFFLLLVLMMNFQSTFHDNNIRLLNSAIKRSIRNTTGAEDSFTTIQSVSDLWHWLENTLPSHLYNDPRLTLVGSPRFCQYNSGSFSTNPTSWKYSDLCTHPTLGENGSHNYLRCMEEPCQLLGNTIQSTKQIIQTLKNVSWIDRSTLELEITQYHKDAHLYISTILQLNLSPHGIMTSRLTILPFHILDVRYGLNLPMVLALSLLLAAICFLYLELAAIKDLCTMKSSYSPDWTQVIIGLISAAIGFVHFGRISLTKYVMAKYHAKPWAFINLYDVAMLSQIQVALSASLLFLIMLKISKQLRFVRRWSIFGKIFQKLKRDLFGCVFFITILFLAFIHFVSTISYMKELPVFTLQHGFGHQFVLKRFPFIGLCLGLVLSVVCRGLLCGLVLSVHRSIRTENYCQALEPQDHEMIDFLVKRLKLLLGVSKVKEYRHTVRFEGLESHSTKTSNTALSTHTLTFEHDDVVSLNSPQPLFSPGLALEHLPTAVTNLLDRMDKVTTVLREVYTLEKKLYLWQIMQRSYKAPRKETESSQENTKQLPLPRTYSTFSESALTRLKYMGHMSDNWMFQRATSESTGLRAYPASAGLLGKAILPIRRPHSEERSGVCKKNEVIRTVPQKRKAWDSEKPEEDAI